MAWIITDECPKCGEVLVVKVNRKNGQYFIGCSGWPDCEFTSRYDRALEEAVVDLETRKNEGINWSKELKALIAMVHPDRPCDQHSVTVQLNYLRDRYLGKVL